MWVALTDTYSAAVVVRSIVINPSVCVCLSASISLWDRWTYLREILCADRLWPWLGPPPSTLRYVMYFGFYGWRHVWPYWARRRNVEAAPCSDGHDRRGDTGTESDVYECIQVSFPRCRKPWTYSLWLAVTDFYLFIGRLLEILLLIALVPRWLARPATAIATDLIVTFSVVKMRQRRLVGISRHKLIQRMPCHAWLCA